MRHAWIVSLLACTLPGLAVAQTQALNLMPMPAKAQVGTGQLPIGQSFSVVLTRAKNHRLKNAVGRFRDEVSRRTGMPLATEVEGSTNPTLTVEVEHAGKEIPELGEDESYNLNISPAGAKLTAATDLGAMHGLQTFLQLVVTTPDGFAVPSITVQDQPRFPWRGLLIDVSRHFIPLDVIKRNLDGMAALKMNVFHWHLSDDQGFRVESKTFPKLQELGSDGLYFSQDQIRELIAYASERGIRVVPEFDIPGHTISWFVGYPELASAPGPYKIERTWGVHDPAIDPTREETYKFLDKFIGEMAKLFPDKYFHIGGDEVNGKQWSSNPKIQDFIHSHGMKNNQDLQAYFNKRLQQIVSKHGKIMEGWDEILHPDLPKSIVVQSWRGQDSLAQAAKQGYRGLLSFGYYLDLMWPAARHYSVDPLTGATATLSPEEKQRILGGEACIWAEYVSPENIDSRIWPRAAAVAERLWSAQEVRDTESMYRRLNVISHELDFPQDSGVGAGRSVIKNSDQNVVMNSGQNSGMELVPNSGLQHNTAYYRMLRRIAGMDDITALRVLADVVEPVKDYSREDLAPVPATQFTPLNRLVDAARPESDAARHFSQWVDAYIAGSPKKSELEAQLRETLTTWRDNQTRLQPLLQKSFLLKEVVPLSQNLSSLGSSGLAALDYLHRGERAPEAWKQQQLALIQEAQKPKAQLLLVVSPSVQKLINFSSGAK